MNSIKNWISAHPNLTAWFALALGMVAILIFEARDVGLESMQWFWLIVVTILVAGACIWIISWGDDEEESEDRYQDGGQGSRRRGVEVAEDAGNERQDRDDREHGETDRLDDSVERRPGRDQGSRRAWRQ